MAESSYDCIVIGSGPGGYVAAIRAAQLGLKTAVVERDKLGGRCLNYACIPAKAVLRSADLLSEIREAEEFGLKVTGVEIDYAAVQARREKVVSTLTGGGPRPTVAQALQSKSLMDAFRASNVSFNRALTGARDSSLNAATLSASLALAATIAVH